jgi:hypothetical protein
MVSQATNQHGSRQTQQIIQYDQQRNIPYNSTPSSAKARTKISAPIISGAWIGLMERGVESGREGKASFIEFIY